MKLSIISIIAITSSLNFNINLAHAQNFAHFDHMATKGSSTYVSQSTNPEHFLRYNASRTCGDGHNSMTKQHRRNHQYRRPHTHIYTPWHEGCSK